MSEEGTPTEVEKVSPQQVESARHVLGYFGDSRGYKAGSFTNTLIAAINLADRMNSAKLGVVYPELAEAVYLYKNRDDGVDILRLRAIQ